MSSKFENVPEDLICTKLAEDRINTYILSEWTNKAKLRTNICKNVRLQILTQKDYVMQKSLENSIQTH